MRIRVQTQVVEGNDPHRSQGRVYERDRECRGEARNGRSQTIVFYGAVSFL